MAHFGIYKRLSSISCSICHFSIQLKLYQECDSILEFYQEPHLTKGRHWATLRRLHSEETAILGPQPHLICRRYISLKSATFFRVEYWHALVNNWCSLFSRWGSELVLRSLLGCMGRLSVLDEGKNPLTDGQFYGIENTCAEKVRDFFYLGNKKERKMCLE